MDWMTTMAMVRTLLVLLLVNHSVIPQFPSTMVTRQMPSLQYLILDVKQRMVVRIFIQLVINKLRQANVPSLVQTVPVQCSPTANAQQARVWFYLLICMPVISHGPTKWAQEFTPIRLVAPSDLDTPVQQEKWIASFTNIPTF